MVYSGVRLAVTAALGATLATASSACVPQDSPNPISSQYPSVVTGNLNGTTMIIPISLETARKVIPPEYPIIERAIHAQLPHFPHGMYPMMAVAVHDHDLKMAALGLSIPDFSRTSLEFPFLDLLHDGYTSFRWSSTMLITDGSPAILGSAEFGIKVYPSKFKPECDAYKASSPHGGSTFKAHSSPGQAPRSMDIEIKPSHDKVPYPLDFIKNITNQPVFANPVLCDNYRRLFNTSLSEPPFDPVPVKGSVSAKLEPFTEQHTWKDVYGWRLSTGFLEPPIGTLCGLLQGYRGSGPGDSTEF